MGRHRQDYSPDVGLDLLSDALPLTPQRWRLDRYNGVEYYRLPTGDDINVTKATLRERVHIWLAGIFATLVLITAWVTVGLTVVAAGEWLLGA